jgi:hypothetical protein
MLRVCIACLILSIAACISSPEVTLVDHTRDAPVSPDGSAERIALVEDLGRDAGAASEGGRDGGVLPHPERDAEPSDDEGGGDDDEGDDGDPDDDGPKGKPPRKKKP